MTIAYCVECDMDVEIITEWSGHLDEDGYAEEEAVEAGGHENHDLSW